MRTGLSPNRFAQRRYYRRNRIKILRKQRAHRKGPGKELTKARSKIKVNNHLEFIAAIKIAKGCMDCGYKKHSAALDFF